MERLTTKIRGKSLLVKGMSISDIEEAVDRLAAYEDTGLEPEEIVEKIGWLSPICIGCPGKTEGGKRTELCGEPDDLERCVEQSKRLAALARAALRREQE